MMRRGPPVFAQRQGAAWARLAGHQRTAAGAGGVLALLAAMAICGVVAAEGWQARERAAAVRAEADALQARAARAPQLRPVREAEPARRAWNAIAQQLNTPWLSLLATLEAATPDDVALVAIEPDARKATVRLQAEARTLDALLAYAQALRQQPLVGDVALYRHETNEQDASRPLRMHLELRLAAGAGGGR